MRRIDAGAREAPGGFIRARIARDGEPADFLSDASPTVFPVRAPGGTLRGFITSASGLEITSVMEPLHSVPALRLMMEFSGAAARASCFINHHGFI
jgi:hypothetical protein